MSNVVKLKKKKPGIETWQPQIDEMGDKLTDRVYDAIRLADEEAKDIDMPDEFADCTLLGVLTSILVQITEKRNIVGPDALLKLVEFQIHSPYRHEGDAS
jgi:hypothetical protein